LLALKVLGSISDKWRWQLHRWSSGEKSAETGLKSAACDCLSAVGWATPKRAHREKKGECGERLRSAALQGEVEEGGLAEVGVGRRKPGGDYQQYSPFSPWVPL
jgi:hypothetical protein